MTVTINAKYCLSCNRQIRGRTDKKFCDDQCRSTYNNQLKTTDGKQVKNINNRLLRNRSILKQTLGALEKVIVPRNKLEMQGYLFSYHTHTITDKKGNTLFFCYEYGYSSLSNERCLIVKQQEE
jgi:hypothetical protein